VPSRYPRVQKTFGILFVAAGIAVSGGGIAYDRYLSKTKPTKPTPATGEIVSIDKGNPHHYVTNDEYLLEGILITGGFVVAVFGARLIKETK
jgi:hypothetical protein